MFYKLYILYRDADATSEASSERCNLHSNPQEGDRFQKCGENQTHNLKLHDAKLHLKKLYI